MLNIQKLALEPTHCLGYKVRDTAQAKVLLPQEKCLSLRSQMESLRLEIPSIWACMKMLGKMVAIFNALLYAQFHSKALQLNILPLWDKRKESLDLPMLLTTKSRSALKWWISTQMLDPLKSFLPIKRKVLVTDTRLLT